MRITQISKGRFHHFHLARQLQKQGVLDCIWTGYARFKLRQETGIPEKRLKTYPWIQTPYMALNKFGINNWQWLEKEASWWSSEMLDRHVATNLPEESVLVALSATGLNSGRVAQNTGGKFICDRGSSHIRFQDEILKDEYSRWGLKFRGIDPRVVAKEEAEYQIADKITIPSEFVRNSFIQKGVSAEKLVKIPYGVTLDRFQKVADPKKNRFTILWVGNVSIRKGFLYLLEAFEALQHPNKEIKVIGPVEAELKAILSRRSLDQVQFLGQVANADLVGHYSSAHVFVLPSIEEGLAMVQGEALACGCPVIATQHAGAEDLFTDGKEGFIIPIRSSSILKDRLQLLADNEDLRLQLSEAAIQRVKEMGGWDTYGANFKNMLESL